MAPYFSLAYIAFTLFGIPGAPIWGLATALLSLVPKIGTVMIYGIGAVIAGILGGIWAGIGFGVYFIEYDEDRMPEVTQDKGNVKVQFIDPVLQKKINLSPDLVVLSTGIIPNEDNEKIAKMLII